MRAASSGAVAALCERVGVDLLVLFGSAADDDAVPRDVDVAVRFRPDTAPDLLDLLEELYALTGYEGFDILDLRRAAPLVRDRALSGGRPLYQAGSGVFGNAQIAAMMERLETEEFRRLELELMGR